MVRKPHSQLGFTLVEMIVALAVFSVVVTIAVGALLVLIASNEQLQQEQSVMTNLSFALDSMAREIRTGTSYYCNSAMAVGTLPTGEKIFKDGEMLDQEETLDCPNGNSSGHRYQGISFVEGGQSITQLADTRIVYFFNNDPSSSDRGKIFRRIEGGDAQSIVSSGIYIEEAEFYVSGSTPLNPSSGLGEESQPSVTIFIKARALDDPTAKPYYIQTSITQRALDI